MKQMYNFEELVGEVERLHTLKRDITHPTKDVILYSDSTYPSGLDVAMTEDGADGETCNFYGKLSERALKQMCETYDVPFSYVKTMRNRNEDDLVAKNLNTWLQKPDLLRSNRRLFRCYRQEGENPAVVRSIHSDRYKIFDNIDLLEALRPTLKEVSDDLGGWQVKSSGLTDQKFYLKIVFPKFEADIDPAVGDIVQSGLVISNSEVGQGAISVTRLLFRLACLNGMVLPDGKARSTHLGKSQVAGESNYQDDTRKIMNQALVLQLRDHIKSAADGRKFYDSVAQMRMLSDSIPAAEPEKALENLSDKFSLSEEETKHARRSLLGNGNFNAWGMVNSITNIANKTGDYDRASEIEVIGGKVAHHLSNEKNWRELAMAA